MSNQGTANPLAFVMPVILIGLGVWFYYGGGLGKLSQKDMAVETAQLEKPSSLPSTEEWIAKLHQELPNSRYFGSAGSGGFPVGGQGESGKRLFDVMGKPARTMRLYDVIQFEFQCSDGTVVIEANLQAWDVVKMLSVTSVNAFPN